MSITKHGRIEDYYADGVAIQPGGVLIEKDDGTIEGQMSFECDQDKFANLPQIGTSHPRDGRAECYTRQIEYQKLGKIKLTASYFGLVTSETDPIISSTPNTNQDTITSHPDFEDFAGTADAPKNGAKFDDDTGDFLGFFDPTDKDLFLAEYYLVPAVLVSLTYWKNSPPSSIKVMTRKPSLPKYRKPENVKEFMLLSVPYRQVGSFFQVTEQYMGSGENGFSEKIYPE